MSMRLPESATSIQSKMNDRIAKVVEAMNVALDKLCADEEASPSKILGECQKYLGLYLQLDNHKMKEVEHREMMKLKRLQTKEKQILVNGMDEDSSGKGSRTERVQEGFSDSFS